jgi:serine/threonine protein kinase
MPSDSVAGFLDKAKASRVLFPEQVEQLVRRPDVPQSDLTELCGYLESHGVLTPFQSRMLRDGRGHELTFAGYPLLDEIGPCPGGTAYRALHPSLRTPVIVRRLRAESLLPADTTGAFVARARAAAAVHHPNLVTLLDAGFHQDEAYAAIEPPADASDLDSLVKEIGPMPVFLAAEYGRQVAAALRAAHERGSWHGDVRPANLLIAPMTNKPAADGTVKRRPAPNAAVRLAGLGLVPIRPPAPVPPDAVLPYLPPERLDAPDYAPRGDLYGLGASLYYLLTARPPFAAGSSGELVAKVRSAEPAALATLRPDLPGPLVELVTRLLAKKPGDRPATAAEVETAVAAFCRGGPAPKPAAGRVAVPVGDHPIDLEDVPSAEPAAPSDEWSADLSSFSTTHADPAPPPRRPKTAKEKGKTRLLLLLGLVLHLTATAFCVIFFIVPLFKGSDSTPGKSKTPDEQKPPNQGPVLSPREKERLNKQK